MTSPSQAGGEAQSPSTAKFKEAERIRVTAWPKPANYRQWRMNLIDEIVAASARPKRAFEWILEVRTPGIAYDDLAEPGDDMATLDAKLSSALAHIAPAEFQRTLQTKKIDAMKENKMIAGRQILFLIDHHFRMSEMDGGVYDTEHLFSVKMKGEKLHEFITLWDDVLARMIRPCRHCCCGICDSVKQWSRTLPITTESPPTTPRSPTAT